ncbi:salicylate hydroxylase [Cordyceps fumosorosea ARSEF 2679]|uniref:Salicylate hydroxylase n=1 Tax=Cordyceps fumosorosea (strain ARSEF 2679) TaxID=1081104 RepID=A0A167LGP5_CORFA|nr:salicylate hydroxylase [Cordyceps fumosorosea ARSEF 2679]OAA53069.1 salicylate hydroxylase [Cordyceps fumosorosea ARSEF 2679]
MRDGGVKKKVVSTSTKSGLQAIRACGLSEAFACCTSDCSEAWKIINADGVALYADEGGNNRPEIARQQLMRLLLSKLPDDKIRWGAKLTSAERVGEGKTRLNFGDDADVFDVVIGADGVHRPPEPDPHYLLLAGAAPDLAEFCGDGTICVLQDGNGVIKGQHGVRRSERLYITMASADENFAEREGIHDMDAVMLYTFLTTTDTLYNTFADMPKRLIKAACEDSTAPGNRGPTTRYDLRPFYKLPVGHRWDPVPGVTILGDAAHLMTTYAGEGVNLAMRDALDVGAAIPQAWKVSKNAASLKVEGEIVRS